MEFKKDGLKARNDEKEARNKIKEADLIYDINHILQLAVIILLPFLFHIFNKIEHPIYSKW